MGYESRFYIVLKTAGDDFDHIGKSLTYFYAEFNVGKLGVQDMLSKYPDTDMYFYKLLTPENIGDLASRMSGDILSVVGCPKQPTIIT